MGAAVFIDAGYFVKVLYHDHNNARVDFEKLGHAMAAPDALFRTYYYNCMPYQGMPPTGLKADFIKQVVRPPKKMG